MDLKGKIHPNHKFLKNNGNNNADLSDVGYLRFLMWAVDQLIPFAHDSRVVWGEVVQQAHVIVRHGPTPDFKRVVQYADINQHDRAIRAFIERWEVKHFQLLRCNFCP